jgi:hypothetical protein
VANGITPGGGNNKVDGADISALGGAYGYSGAAVTAVNYLDVGPTTDHSVNGRPLTDNAIDFEDLVMFAINYGVGPAQQPVPPARQATTTASVASADRLLIEAPTMVTAGQEFTVSLRLEGTGRVQALSASLAWNAGVVEPVAVEAGVWLKQLEGVVFSSKAGAADVALLGVPGGGFTGTGEIAVLRFRALAAGSPRVAVATLQARDASNEPVELASSVLEAKPSLPAVTTLAAVFPNPFQGSTAIGFSLREPGPVTLAVFGVDGRRVRTLASGHWEAGIHRLGWDGRDDQGHPASAGVYFVQLTTAQGRFTKRISRLQ